MVRSAIEKKKKPKGPTRTHETVGKNIYFYSTRSPFSNFHPVPGGLEHEGVVLPTSEHHMMLAKALQNGNTEIAEKIRKARTPAEAKQLGRDIQPFNKERWRETNLGIVTRILVSKFRHPDLRDHLLSTDGCMLYEASPKDPIWGIGISVRHAASGMAHKGENRLGKALMRARTVLNEERLGVVQWDR